MNTARLTHAGKLLTIAKGKTVSAYVVEDFRPDPRVADPAFSLTKEDGEAYHVHQDQHGWHCTCADWTFRSKRDGCKHLKAMRVTGKILASE